MKNVFAGNISNEEVASLPVLAFGGRIIVVDRPEQVEEACEYIMSSTVIGFDTETRPTFRPGALNKTALLQLSTDDRCYLFRLCRIPLDKRIIKILESKKVIKIGADIANDLRALRSLRHFTPGGFIDLQDIVSEWGIAEKSVRKMTAIVLGGRISKAQRLSNWEAANLTQAQLMYASTDAWVCLRIFRRLNSTGHMPTPDGGTWVRPVDTAKKKIIRKPRKKNNNDTGGREKNTDK